MHSFFVMLSLNSRNRLILLLHPCTSSFVNSGKSRPPQLQRRTALLDFFSTGFARRIYGIRGNAHMAFFLLQDGAPHDSLQQRFTYTCKVQQTKALLNEWIKDFFRKVHPVWWRQEELNNKSTRSSTVTEKRMPRRIPIGIGKPEETCRIFGEPDALLTFFPWEVHTIFSFQDRVSQGEWRFVGVRVSTSICNMIWTTDDDTSGYAGRGKSLYFYAHHLCRKNCGNLMLECIRHAHANPQIIWNWFLAC